MRPLETPDEGTRQALQWVLLATLRDHLSAREQRPLWAAQGGLHLTSLTSRAFILPGPLLVTRQAWSQQRPANPGSTSISKESTAP